MSESEFAHTVTSFGIELRTLDAAVGNMLRLAQTQLSLVVDSVANRDAAAAAEALAMKDELDHLNEVINDQSVRVLALRQPLADDLRSVVTALKVAGMLDRVGDYGAEAAERAQQLVAGPEIPVHGTIRRMGSLVRDMYVDAADAFLSRDPLLAKSVWARDEEVDAVHSGLFRELLTYMLEDPRLISSCSHLLFISKTVERYGDQATNIAEAAYYRTTGYPMEGERPKGDVSTLMAVGSDPDDILPL